ncbi:MAG: tetratricopeptide repeat protein, partial [Oscillospiraceae bacterium]|nr:tetratricopeptide repeat protein [Oscillospiraceae bacterium]
MAVLKYITKGNRSPQGVPRVYFCCHPDEQSLFLEPVAKLLLEKQSCAVFYLEDPAGERDADFWADLKQVQLFVMPVTTRLLTTENPAMEEFRFAVENHIPVLPLMQESGLDKIFAEKCGDLQYLNPNARDDTALSFDEKLSKYLQNVLIGDELAEKIRAAFDAYVFLSYRKKDRRYAQELMRLIHKNDFCRDIAIWYDEFLTPGEDFNDSIREALEKSGLFVLAVTPNLVNEVNYVMTTEYPMAQTAGKPILPAEMVTTDSAALAKHYPSIPAITDAHDEEALTAALLEKVKGLAILENDTSPEHNFFIGLAYLGGVDVETDHERALALITGAAEAGLPEAMKKLVSMYREGLGVARNYQTAIAWQRRVAEYYRNAYETDQTEKAGYRYLSALWNLGDYIYETRQIPAAGAVYTEMLRFCGNLQNTHGTNNRIRRYLSVAYNKVGNIYEAMGKLSEALSRYEAFMELAKQLAEETGTVKARRDLSVSYNKVGNIYRAMGKLSKALSCYEASLELRRQLAEETGTVEARRDLSVSYDNVGNIYRAMGKLSEALSRYEASIELRRLLVEET